MIRSKAESESMEPPADAYWDPVVKKNRAKRLQLFTRLLDIGLLRPRLKGTAKHFLGIFFVDKKGKKDETFDPGCSRGELGVRLSAQRDSLCSSVSDGPH